MYKYYKYAVITVIWFISTASFASGNLQKTTNNFNFKNISVQKNYSALDYGEYDPAKAIDACTISTGKDPDGRIWPADPSNPFPSPAPNTDGSDCEMSSQMAYGCTDYDNYTGRALTKSVVGIMVRDYHHSGLWFLTCTGTIIDNQWVLTSAHCVAKLPHSGLITLGSIIVPGQQLPPAGKFGVPPTLYQKDLGKYKVINVYAIIIPRIYHQLNSGRYDTNEYNPDLALLKIDQITPDMGLKPIPVANTSVLSKPETPVITAGYGSKEDQKIDGELSYRKNYYITNMYDSSWHGGVSNNYGDLFISGSMPIDYKGVKSAWSFNGPSDSGGPVLSYNSLTGKFQIEGVFLGSLFCNYAGYFAKLPYPYSIAASTTYQQNYDFIKSVMNGTPDPSQVRCSGGCYLKNLYVVNQNSNNINSYKFNMDNSLLLNSTISTGVQPSQITFSQEYNLAAVPSPLNNSIFLYNVNSEGHLINKRTLDLSPGYNATKDIAFLFSGNMIILARNNSHLPSDSQSYSLIKYDFKYDGSWSFEEAYQTLNNSRHLNVIDVNNYEYLLVNNDNEINVYEERDNDLVNNYDKLKLTSEMGKLIEIKPFGEPANTRLYVLTTNGVYIYQLTRRHKRLTFKLVKNFLNHFSSDSHIVPLYENSFAISKRGSNSVLIYEVSSPDNTITLENHITIPDPSGMEFDNGILYITSIPRSLYSYKISYPLLTVSTKHQTLQTGDGPTVVKIGRRRYR